VWDLFILYIYQYILECIHLVTVTHLYYRLLSVYKYAKFVVFS